MASKMLGRAACPECGFPHAHVKQKEGEGKFAYRYCPDCGSQYYARSQAQHNALVNRLTHPPAIVAQPDPEPAPTDAPTEAPKGAPEKRPADLPAPDNYKIILGVRVPA